MHTLSHTREGLGVVGVGAARGPLLLPEHHPGLSEKYLEIIFQPVSIQYW